MDVAPLLLSCGACGFDAPKRDGIWIFAPEFTPAGFLRERRNHLAELEPRHFWFRSRLMLLQACLHRFTRGGGHALELGCGAGSFLVQLAQNFTTLTGVDAYAESLIAAHQRVPSATLIQADACRVPLASAQFDMVAALDVLEHVCAEELLREARRLLTERGLLLLTVPASLSLMSKADEVMGHRCRYRLSDLRGELETARFRLLYHTYYQFLLFPLVWLARHLPLSVGWNLERRPPAVVSSLLQSINDAEVTWFQGKSLPWGSSLVAIAAAL
jgi:ubiquinone/menaquinone biosynthesis C-methylase UbiE